MIVEGKRKNYKHFLTRLKLWKPMQKTASYFPHVCHWNFKGFFFFRSKVCCGAALVGGWLRL